MKRNRLWSYLALYQNRQAALMGALAARFASVCHKEGFAVDTVAAPRKLIADAAPWAKTERTKTKLLRIINALDDRAIRYRMEAVHEQE